MPFVAGLVNSAIIIHSLITSENSTVDIVVNKNDTIDSLVNIELVFGREIYLDYQIRPLREDAQIGSAHVLASIWITL